MARKTPPPPQPWDRLEKESEEAYGCFVAYREQAYPRRYVLTPSSGKFVDPVQVRKYAKQFDWESRVRAYDAFLDAERQAARLAIEKQTVEQVTLEHKIALSDARELVRREIAKRLTLASRSDFETMSAKELATWLDLVIKHDRLIRGEHTDKVATETNLANLSSDELRALYTLRKKIDAPSN